MVVEGTYSRDHGFEGAAALLAHEEPPTALIAGNSQLGIGVLAALNERGMHHGTDLSLVICDNLELLQLMDPPMSVVARDAEKMGAVAAQLLLDRLHEDASRLRNVILPTYYVPGRSTIAPRTTEKPEFISTPSA